MQKRIKNRIATLLNIDKSEIQSIVQRSSTEYAFSLTNLKSYVYDEELDYVIEMINEKNLENNNENFLTQEEKNKFFEENRKLIGYAMKFVNVNKDIDREELEQVASLGFAKALSSFNKKRNTKLSTYVVKCMLNEMYYFLRKEQKVIYNNISMDKTLSIDANGNSLTVGDTIESTKKPGTRSIEDEVLLTELDSVLINCVSELSESEQFLITYRYGLNNNKIKTQTEIAKHLKMSQANISKLEKNCLKKLRLILRKNKYQYNAKSKTLKSNDEKQESIDDINTIDYANENIDATVRLLVAEKLDVNLFDINEVKLTEQNNIFWVDFNTNRMVYVLVNIITGIVEIHKKNLSNEELFLAFIYKIPLIGFKMNRDIIYNYDYNINIKTSSIRSILKNLSKDDKYIIEHCYGLNGKKILTISQIALDLNQDPNYIYNKKLSLLSEISENVREKIS